MEGGWRALQGARLGSHGRVGYRPGLGTGVTGAGARLTLLGGA
jgi:hypothetical protein